MKYHGLEIDATGLAALIMAITAFYTAVWGAKKRERYDKKKREAADTDEDMEPRP